MSCSVRCPRTAGSSAFCFDRKAAISMIVTGMHWTELPDKSSNKKGKNVRGMIRNGPNTVSESTVSNTELSEFFLALTEIRGVNSVSSFRPTMSVPKRTHRVFSQNSPEFSSETVLSKQYSARFLNDQTLCLQAVLDNFRP